MDCSTMKPTAFRELVRSGRFTGQTSGVCNGYAQANLVILPKDLAFDFSFLQHAIPTLPHPSM